MIYFTLLYKRLNGVCGMIELCASVLAANHAHIARDIKLAEQCGINRFHFDVCDGHYTRNIIFGNQLIKDLKEESASYFDVHLAVFHMDEILKSFLDTGTDMINIQYETSDHPDRLFKLLHEYSIDVSVCFTLESGMDVIKPFLEKVDAVNLLAVHPGIGGQRFYPQVLHKIEMTAGYIKRNNLKTKISVDGGVNASTLRQVIDAGTDIAILGNGIFCGNICENIYSLNNIIHGS